MFFVAKIHIFYHIIVKKCGKCYFFDENDRI